MGYVLVCWLWINKRNSGILPPDGSILLLQTRLNLTEINRIFFLTTLNSYIHGFFFFEHDTKINPVICSLQIELSQELEGFSLLKIL